MSTILKIENISKQYRLGVLGTGTLSHDLNRWWHLIRGKDDPYLKVGELNDRSTKGNSNFVWALKDININVEKGDVIGIIGKNGAGKSTLLKILSKVTTPSTGNIKTKGRIASLLEVGTGFHPELTGKENIYLNGAILGMTKKEITSKIDEIISFSGCERYIDTPVKRYSSGMTVRLAFAVAAHLEPDILVIDEVLAVGDAEFQKKAIGKMQSISKTDGRTILFVSHNMIAVKSLCNKGIHISNGSVVFEGDINSTVNNYLSQNKFLSERNINFKNNGVTFESISITDNGLSGYFNIYEKLEISIKLKFENRLNEVNTNIFFNSAEGGVIFATVSDTDEVIPGEYIYNCTIPSGTLNDNTYSLDLMVVSNKHEAIIDIKDVIVIQGIEKKREGAWLGKYPGSIRPTYFNWKKTKI